jgi:nicotinamidase-related amidase
MQEVRMQNAHGMKIYENLNEIVAPDHSCLVVWDVQVGLVDRIFNKDEFLRALKGLIESLRKKVPIVYTRIAPEPKGFQSPWRTYYLMRRFNVKTVADLPPFMAPESREREIPPDVQPGESDIVLDKPTASIFIGTNFEYLMRNKGITTLIFSGITTEIGIESSARDAGNRGFYPVVVSDCVSSHDKEAHERSLKNLEKIVIVKKSTDVLQSVG